MMILLPILAYLIGSIPSALLIGKIFYKIDVREHGSGNLGATNTFRILGKKAGMIVSVLDVLKGTVATLLPQIFGYNHEIIHPIYLGILAVIGHVWPIFAGFRGGKAVATSAGIILAYSPILYFLLAIVFFSTLKVSKYVSLASMLSGIFAFLYSLFSFFVFEKDWHFIILMGAICLFILVKHRANIQRIKTKTEPKVSWI